MVDPGPADENEEEEGVDEKGLIKAMLAKEEEKDTTEKPVQGPLMEHEANADETSETLATTSATPVTVASPTTPPVTPTTAANYPVSKDGSCPHCGSTTVRYIILVKDSTKDITLPPTLDKLLKMGKAFKMAKGANNPPSFQCCTCTYGFNLDWSKTNLKKIFKLEEESSSNTTSASSSAVISSSTYQNYTTSYPASSLQTSTYGSYSAYTRPPPMGYPAVPQYGYPAPAPLVTQPMTRIIPAPQMAGMAPPPMAGMAPQPYGVAPIPYAGAPLQPYPGMAPQPYGPPPTGLLTGPPQPFPGAPPNQFGPIPPGSMPLGVPPVPTRVGAPMYGMQPPGNMNFRGTTGQGNIPGVMPVSVSGQTPGPYSVPLQPLAAVPMQGSGPYPVPRGLAPFPGTPQNLMPGPRLRVPNARLRGRNNKHLKGKPKEKQVNHENHGSTEVQEQWSQDVGESQDNDGEEDTNEDVYDPEAATRFEELLNKIDEKPPGEDTQAEFEVAAFTPDEKPAEPVENIVENIDKSDGTIEKAAAVSETRSTEPEAMKQDTSSVTVNNLSETAAAPEPANVCEDTSDAGNSGQGNDSSVTSGVESGGLEPSPKTASRGKSTRGRKRQATGGRKTARNTRTKKVVENAGYEDRIGNDNDGLTGTDEVKKVKLSDEQTQENTDADENIQEATIEEDIQPKRVTRARTQRRKK
ncbi:splicing factor, arginine/serine-rich 15-like isoform X2 [Dendronephthya gigantea]|uniref:splicing factor, arginine/serine-rich 15-like isoform X2 n=1 Tax=Dendronephthya gigantea TaxID=151771 RepID=UPI00106C9E4D|nr:splicing factor, arginine/serine-rich 15-like isoform X2 [Dendronephthya gigantea]